MFGYIRPHKNQLKVIELERFKSLYCGLCTAITKRYGIIYSNLLSYDITFFALVLGSFNPDFKITQRRCTASPIKQKNVEVESEIINLSADISILLAYHKAKDNLKDEKNKLLYGSAKIFIFPAYKKAMKNQPYANKIIIENLEKLDNLEKNGETSIDKSADCFGNLLSNLANIYYKDDFVNNIFYHTGRWIYIIDAIQDVMEDYKKGEYNPISARFDIKNGVITPFIKKELEFMTGATLYSIQTALDKLESKKDIEIIENIINLSMPQITYNILEGEINESI